MESRASAILKRYQRASTDRSTMATTWRELADYIRPVKQDIGVETSADFRETPNNPRIAALFDTSVVDANMTYAAGCMSWMTPSETHWFAFDAPPALQGEEDVKRWYGQVTEETRRIVALSNFYSQIHEVYLDDGAFGTSGLLVEEPSGDLRFEALQIGDYCILEDDHRNVDSVFRDFRLTARQAEQKFGRDALHETMRKFLDENAKEIDQRFEFVHAIMPRRDADRVPGKVDSRNMPWASVYIDKKHQHIVRESGTWENPAAVHRHLLWSHSVYGFSPGMIVLPDARQLNSMQQILDTLVEKQVSPPVMAPSSFEGDVDLRAGGVTYFESQAEKPEFWQNPGNYLIGQDRTEFRKGQIHKAFHVELFQALSAVPPGKQMTAAEVHSRQRDRLTLFSPTFARKNNELNTPVMKRVFALLLRAGAYPPPPPRLVQQNADGVPFIPDPEVVYTSRLALQIKAIHNDSYARTMELVGPMVQMMPQLLDHFDVDEIVRGLARNEGLREAWLRQTRDVDEIRKSRAEAEARAEEEARSLETAETAAKMQSAGIPVAAA